MATLSRRLTARAAQTRVGRRGTVAVDCTDERGPRLGRRNRDLSPRPLSGARRLANVFETRYVARPRPFGHEAERHQSDPAALVATSRQTSGSASPAATSAVAVSNSAAPEATDTVLPTTKKPGTPSMSSWVPSPPKALQVCPHFLSATCTALKPAFRRRVLLRLQRRQNRPAPPRPPAALGHPDCGPTKDGEEYDGAGQCLLVRCVSLHRPAPRRRSKSSTTSNTTLR